MKREDITSVFPDATKDQIDKIMGINGEDINKAKGDLDAVKGQLTEAQTALEAARKSGGGAADKLKEAQDQAAAYKAELDSLKLANGLREMREKVAAEKKLPVHLLTADTEEGCNAQAEQILAFTKSQKQTGYPSVPDGGSPGSGSTSSRQQFADWAKDFI